MKHILIVLIACFALASCREKPKDFNAVAIGMTKDQVTAVVGEPAKKNELAIADLWVYPDADRSIIFRKDTVYNIITSADARIDSIEAGLKSTGDDLKNTGEVIDRKLERFGDSVKRTADQIKDKFKRDTTK